MTGTAANPRVDTRSIAANNGRRGTTAPLPWYTGGPLLGSSGPVDDGTEKANRSSSSIEAFRVRSLSSNAAAEISRFSWSATG